VTEVFVSYSHEDRERVLSVVVKLQARGIDIWIDRYKIPGGSNWGQEIIEGIKACKVLLLMASDHSLNSDAVTREIVFATDRSKRIVPLVIQKQLAETDKTSFWLAALQRIDAAGEFEDWSKPLFQALSVAGVVIPDDPRTGPASTVDRPTAETSVMTCLMAHLADRAEQERQIFLGLERHFDQRPARPLVFVVHGRVTQCIDEFVRRLRLHTLPRQFTLLGLPDQLAWELVPWPKPLASGQHDQSKERVRTYRFDLCQKLRLRSTDGIEALHRRLANLRSSIGLWSLIPSEYWQPDEPALIDEVMRFWADLPDLPQPLLLFFVVAYRETDRSLLARWLSRRPSREIRDTVAALERAGPYKLDIVVLPELADITQAECEHWIRDILRPANIAWAMQQLNQSFQDERLTPQQGIAMERLLPVLNRLMPAGTMLRGL